MTVKAKVRDKGTPPREKEKDRKTDAGNVEDNLMREIAQTEVKEDRA